MKYSTNQILYRALEPIHVGSGGFRLGRVDMTIAREPGTGLPKIPGTSLAGAARAYAALLYGRPEAGGQHLHYKPEPGCPIIHTFGTAHGDQGQAGRVSFGDARILLFPVATMQGPVFVTTAELLKDAGISAIGPSERESLAATFDISRINLGWLLFEKVEKATAPTGWGKLSGVKDKMVLVHPSLFPQVVNSNLEVRTSVSIDPKTGAAEQGALFSYEAIPRATWLMNELVEDAYGDAMKAVRVENGATWNTPMEVAKAGLGLMATLGVGGMGTRGFGRMEMVGEVRK